MSGGRDAPGVVAPPPLIYAGALALGLLANRLRPAGFLPRGAGRVLGVPLLAGGFAVGIAGLRAMRRVGTNVNPEKPTTAVVSAGPYRLTRNPLYLAMTLAYAGISLLANALWPVLLLPGVLVVIRKGVIAREEAYLERRFGDEYLRYKETVRRWI